MSQSDSRFNIDPFVSSVRSAVHQRRTKTCREPRIGRLLRAERQNPRKSAHCE